MGLLASTIVPAALGPQVLYIYFKDIESQNLRISELSKHYHTPHNIHSLNGCTVGQDSAWYSNIL